MQQTLFGQRGSRDLGTEQPEIAYGTPATKMVVSGLRSHSGWEATNKALTFTPFPLEALAPDGEEIGGSPYKKSVIQGATIVPRVLFFVQEEATTSRLGMSSGRVNYRSMRTPLEKNPWKSLPDLNGVIERRFIYDVHLGSTVVPFHTLQPWRAILPIDKDRLLEEEHIETADSTLAQWWHEATSRWEQNRSAANKLSLRHRIDYQNTLSRQLGAPAHRVVYSASGTSLAAARLSSPRQVVEHKLYWIPARNIQEAQYLTAIINAPLTTKTVAEYQSRGLFGARDFDTYVWRLPIPVYDSEQELHQRLVAFAQRAEDIAGQADVEGIGFQKARKVVRAALDAEGIHAELNDAVAKLLGVRGA